MQQTAGGGAATTAAPSMLGISWALPEDMAHSLRGKPTETPAVAVLPVAGLVSDDHVANQDGLEGLSHAFRRKPTGKPPGSWRRVEQPP